MVDYVWCKSVNQWRLCVMNIKHRQLCLVAILPAMLGGGCYTALKGPVTASDFYSEPQYTTYADSDELLAPSVGRFDDPYDDPYRGYSGVAPYGGAYGGYGTPIFGYDSRSGLFGNYGYGRGGGYYPGAGPVGYGYDPYYSGAYGTYVPPGYELVTHDELDHLRANARLNSSSPTNYVPPPDPVLQQERERVEQEVWQQRQESRQRTAPTVTRRPSTSVQRSTKAPTTTRRPTSSAAEKSSSSDDGKEKKKSVTPKKQRR